MNPAQRTPSTAAVCPCAPALWQRFAERVTVLAERRQVEPVDASGVGDQLDGGDPAVGCGLLGKCRSFGDADDDRFACRSSRRRLCIDNHG